MLDDLGRPTTAALASFLDVDKRTVQRWIASDKMPRAPALAIFWLTRWGQFIVDTEAVNDARLQAGLAASYRRTVSVLETRLAHFLTVGDFGSANDPTAHLSSASLRPASGMREPRQSLRFASRSTPTAR